MARRQGGDKSFSELTSQEGKHFGKGDTQPVEGKFARLPSPAAPADDLELPLADERKQTGLIAEEEAVFALAAALVQAAAQAVTLGGFQSRSLMARGNSGKAGPCSE